ncbi:hypothetical protein PPACK8108_LOCUS9788 [Phakopsora pachyrhizi]|uniref:Tet-like 2OG-Fe(II) oxygenase domain-containing protein n=1 Tax=Phakopsora pachyrhizi TaxID=170000 RepID=A0AAV0AZ33_PHAPC|nr:hypothetical protein PPACK8108_LOCUS9788 [Phakopsora pachyrhizi]
MTVLVDEQVRKPTNEKQGGVLNEDQSQGVEDTSGVICVDGLVVSQEARTDRLDYDLSKWEPEEGPLLEKMNEVLSGSLKNVSDRWFLCALEEFNNDGLPSFSATVLNNNHPEAFASALTFTTSEFQNTPHCDCDSSYICCGWWIQVDKKNW